MILRYVIGLEERLNRLLEVPFVTTIPDFGMTWAFF